MQRLKSGIYDEKLVQEWANRFVCSIENQLYPLAKKRTDDVSLRLEKVLDAFSKEGLGTQHFASSNGYGHGDLGKDLIDRVFAKIFGAEKAAVRIQFVSGTHAITTALFGVLRPGDNLLSITGPPYDTLEEVIGIKGSGQGSLIDFGINYEEISIYKNQKLTLSELEKALSIPRKMIFIQRSCGYSWRPSLSISQIKSICKLIHSRQPECTCFVDNCYGEFVEESEPTAVGADLIAGSLIKNPGGTIVPTGGYLAGRSALVEKACCRLTAPGIGTQGGSGLHLNRIILQGIFLAPQMVAEALIGADLVAGVFNSLGFDVQPLPSQHRSDLIQAVRLGRPEILKEVCRAFQRSSPVGSYLNPLPSAMPGYQTDLIMAGGTFIDGSTSEFSADAPLKSPYNLFVQGGTHRSHIKIALIRALVALVRAGFIDLPQTT
ncbi:aminotransferase class I/II-fold pyridoxal phosphate-dependent enzyme [Prochlorococcus marinus]|uniref:Cystathionine beta-lyase family protein involved in aluminum resistance n=1 Tax=Prochlorococcus marinus (strain MIT 9211) TaxID=93059 RepID=A9BDB5_PROM4|nr:Cystathionine beta-lyase family protein involved in aluminum resistance [Prochlorococcus marinus str. MIT 9211]